MGEEEEEEEQMFQQGRKGRVAATLARGCQAPFSPACGMPACLLCLHLSKSIHSLLAMPASVNSRPPLFALLPHLLQLRARVADLQSLAVSCAADLRACKACGGADTQAQEEEEQLRQQVCVCGGGVVGGGTEGDWVGRRRGRGAEERGRLENPKHAVHIGNAALAPHLSPIVCLPWQGHLTSLSLTKQISFDRQKTENRKQETTLRRGCGGRVQPSVLGCLM